MTPTAKQQPERGPGLLFASMIAIPVLFIAAIVFLEVVLAESAETVAGRQVEAKHELMWDQVERVALHESKGLNFY